MAMTRYRDRAFSGKNSLRQFMLSRLQLLARLQATLFPDNNQKSYWGLTMLPEVLTFVFTVNSADNLTSTAIDNLIAAVEKPEYLEHRTAMTYAAGIFGEHASLFSYANRGRRGLPSNEYQSLPEVQKTGRAETLPPSPRKRKTPHPEEDSATTRIRAVLDFAPLPAQLSIFSLGPFEQALVEYLLHSFEVGKIILKNQPNLDQIAKKWANVRSTTFGTQDFQDPHLSLYIQKSALVWAPGDKYLIFRLRSPSMKLIQTIYPQGYNAKQTSSDDQRILLWRLYLWRMYAYGKQSRIGKVARMEDLDGWKEMRADKLGRNKKLKGNVMAYGQFSIAPEEVQLKTFTSFWQSISRVLRALDKTPNTLTPFNRVMEVLDKLTIRNLKKDGLATWLLACDMSEYGFCAPPTVKDLCEKIGPSAYSSSRSITGGSGPAKAFSVIQKERQIKQPYKSVRDLEEGMERVSRTLKGELGDEWHAITGRGWNWVDFEHALCKITREFKGKGA